MIMNDMCRKRLNGIMTPQLLCRCTLYLYVGLGAGAEVLFSTTLKRNEPSVLFGGGPVGDCPVGGVMIRSWH